MGRQAPGSNDEKADSARDAGGSAVARFRGLTSVAINDPGVALAKPRSTPGFMLSPASQVKRSRAKSLEILGREEEAKDHVPEIARIRVQRVQPVLKSNRIRVAPQVAKVLHRHKRAIE